MTVGRRMRVGRRPRRWSLEREAAALGGTPEHRERAGIPPPEETRLGVGAPRPVEMIEPAASFPSSPGCDTGSDGAVAPAGRWDRYGLDRRALVGRQARERRGDGEQKARTPAGDPLLDPPAGPGPPAVVVPPMPSSPPPGNGVGRAGPGGAGRSPERIERSGLLSGALTRQLRRRARRDERRLALELETALRGARQQALRDAKRRAELEERSEGRRTTRSGHPRPKPPLESGSVLLLPAGSLPDPIGPGPEPDVDDRWERAAYSRRAVKTAAAVLALVLALWWAIGAVDDIARVVVDLFHTGRDGGALLQGFSTLG